jgi:hypothetical protein
MQRILVLTENLAEALRAGAEVTVIRSLLEDCLSSIGFMRHLLHPSYLLIRVRRNEPGKRFTSTAHISYKPAAAGELHRASITGSSLFYASSCERDEMTGPITDEGHGLRVAVSESLRELRENHRYGYGAVDPTKPLPRFYVRGPTRVRNVRVTYGVWEVMSPLALASATPLATHDHSWINHRWRDRIFGSYILQDPFNRTGEDDFWRYIGREFNRTGSPHRESSPYIVSGLIAELLFARGFSGISFPSARCDGYGINVALVPAAVETHLRCIKVGQIRVYSRGHELVLDHEAEIKLPVGCTTFSL